MGRELANLDFWLVPTIDVLKNFTNLSRRQHPDAVRYLTPVDRQLLSMLEGSDFAGAPPEVMAGEDILYDVRARMLRGLHGQGTRVLVGTDDSLLSGFAVIDEMQALVDAGLTAADVRPDGRDIDLDVLVGVPGRRPRSAPRGSAPLP